MKEKDKVLQALCDGLGENYKLMEIDLEHDGRSEVCIVCYYLGYR